MEKEKIAASAAGKVIALHSYVKVHDLSTGYVFTLKLVPSAEVNVTSKWISVNSPLGKNLLGKRMGDTITWEAPAKKQKVKILGVYDNL